MDLLFSWFAFLGSTGQVDKILVQFLRQRVILVIFFSDMYKKYQKNISGLRYHHANSNEQG